MIIKRLSDLIIDVTIFTSYSHKITFEQAVHVAESDSSYKLCTHNTHLIDSTELYGTLTVPKIVFQVEALFL